jgi:hypothetical protein
MRHTGLPLLASLPDEPGESRLTWLHYKGIIGGLQLIREADAHLEGRLATEDSSATQGRALHEDGTWGFQFRYPADWHRFTLLENRQGVLYAPDSSDFATSFSVEAKDLGTRITRADVADLRDGFLEGVQSLPECKLLMETSWALDDLIGLEAQYTFRERGCLRKRWVRLLFEGQRQFHVVAQGASPGEYEYWLPQLAEAMNSMQID